MQTRNYDDLVINRWRSEPQVGGLEWDDADEPAQAPALWKDLTLASVVALILWMGAALAFG